MEAFEWSMLTVFCGPDEWGNDLMDRIARDTFAAHPDVANLVVQVCEHAGWSLSYLRDGTIVGTANDGATLSDAARAFAARTREPSATCKYLPAVRRNAVAA